MAELTTLSTLLKRLEAATTKLEDMAMAGVSAASVSNSLAGSALAPQVAGLGPSALASNATAGGSLGVGSNLIMEGFETILSGPLQTYLQLSTKVGGFIEEQSKAVEAAFLAQRSMIELASQTQKPPSTSDALRKLLQPTEVELLRVINIKDSAGRHELTVHLTAVAEGIPALGWVAIEGKPVGYVQDMKESAQYSANRVIKDWKEKNLTHVEWVRSFIALLGELQAYVKKVHTTGLVWNPKGGDPSEAARRLSAPAGGSAPPTGGAAPLAAKPAGPPTGGPGGPPPPPPPPPPPMMDFTPSPASKQPTAADMSAVFEQLNQGEGITANLRKVDKSKMTHKNPELRASGMVTAESSRGGGSPKRTGPGAPPKPASLTLKKPPKLELQGTKWIVENFENNPNVILDRAELNHTVYIFGCKNSTIQVTTKVNAIVLDSCTKTGLCVESLISSLDVVNSKSVQVQILGKTPTVTLDKVDSGMVYLSKEGMETEILTAKCSAINVLVPDPKDDEGDYVEKPIPEQFLTKFVNGKMVTTTVEHSG